MNEKVLKNLEALRAEMRKYKITAVIVPGTDPHQSEYISDHWKVRDWVTGFTGSNGTAVITLDDARLWTDSRYFLQAGIELEGTGITMMKEDGGNDPTIEQWLAENLSEGDLLAVDGSLFSVPAANRLENICGQIGARFAADFAPFDKIYADRPELPLDPIFVHEESYAGESTQSKISRLLDALAENGANATLLSALDEVAWLFNIRCNDVMFNPVATAYAYVSKRQRVLFIDERKVDDATAKYLADHAITVASYKSVNDFLAKVKDDVVLLDPRSTSDTTARCLYNAETIFRQSPVALMKACKNDTQIEGTRRAMERDGVALVKLYMWLEQNVPAGKVNEVDVAEKVVEFRGESPLYRGESFAMAAGYRGNGAIVHYEAEPATAATVGVDGLLLVDTGAQYLDGTTDITRTVCFGTPTEEERHDYTLVLKGHLALGHVTFPEGTRGSQLDALARQFLWKEAKTYWHGTGHGVGHFLNVHEGPQNIRLNENPTTIIPGMIISNEPGLYITDKYGIRIENLVLATSYKETADFGNFLRFETLTLFPYDTKLIDVDMLTDEEVRQVNDYHAMVRSRLIPLLNDEQAAWLNEKTQPITK